MCEIERVCERERERERERDPLNKMCSSTNVAYFGVNYCDWEITKNIELQYDWLALCGMIEVWSKRERERERERTDEVSDWVCLRNWKSENVCVCCK